MIGDPNFVHCDDMIDGPEQPAALRKYLSWARLPAVCKYGGDEKWVSPDLQPHIWREPIPQLFADHEGERYRVVMASRFGDVGITRRLNTDSGYEKRVLVSELSNFSDQSGGA